MSRSTPRAWPSTTSATSAYITDLARRARYGAAHGVFGTIYDIGDALGPIAAGLLVAGVGYGWMFQIMAAVRHDGDRVRRRVTALSPTQSSGRPLDEVRPSEERVMRVSMIDGVRACFGRTAMSAGADRKVDFSEQDAVGQPPKGFEFGHTAKAGAPGKWVVQADGDEQVSGADGCGRHRARVSRRCRDAT